MAGERYGQLVQSARSHHDLVALEERALGVNHAEVSAELLRKWNMPSTLCDAVESSHSLFNVDATSNLSDLQYGVAVAGVMAELWIADSTEQELLNRTIHTYLDRIGEDAYRETAASILDAIPGANQIFNVQLLSDDQMANVA